MRDKGRYTQKNGRERGRAAGLGGGPNDYSPTVRHKGKRDWQLWEDRKSRERGWQEDD